MNYYGNRTLAERVEIAEYFAKRLFTRPSITRSSKANMKRRSGAIASIVEKTILEIVSNSEKGNRIIPAEKVFEICKKNDISEAHIRSVAGWSGRIDPIVSGDQIKCLETFKRGRRL